MIFITVSPKQAAYYAYMCIQLKQMVNKMHTARKTLEGVANTSFDKSFAKCVYLLTSESQQCENEILAHISSLNCDHQENDRFESEQFPVTNAITGIESLCSYFEKAYLNSYKKLLKDKHLGDSVKNLIQNHLQLLISSLAQLRLFYEVKPSMN